ncbi:ribulose-bisphosphate carboxylase large subunit family protein (plasmid) [Cupriavidus sp. KK10]|jgi:ribulose-bisphosphate carboxylase large chain|uniref:ribulose-bisphosphate carboxylase large subunit family protein n=1 Tax=Cupriavidus sp. KK10 TaxID=1478019 RepID=UPI001BA67D51|nr:ribulose-bisphosphate carboxylase large subunit family protein [Cupriavidus sp. KK10]QUN32120.1 ribulose-bisphosphate carboxylase large subunit family protein [Cupriavidus sp. KK10]
MTITAARAEFTARYFVESSLPAEKIAQVIAGEQSSGTFLTLPGETAQLKERSRARVVNIHSLPPTLEPSLRSAYVERRGSHGVFHRAEIEIAFPIENVGPNLPVLLATLAGNLFELGEVTGLRLLDLDMPVDYASRFPGPAFSIEGTRRLAGVHGRPMIGTIVKPSIGLTAEQTAAMVDDLCGAGIDFIKDDELIANPPYEPFERRVAAVMSVLHKHADRLGRMPMYAFNISGSIDDMLRQHDTVLQAGGTCVMVSVNWAGFAGVEHLRRHSQLPIHGHRNGWGSLTRHPALGFSFEAYQKLWRLAGVDHLHVNGLRSKFWEADESVLCSARACLSPFAGVPAVMPVFSSGQWAAQAPDMYRQLQSTDLMHLAGGGIIGHPDGIRAGVASMREGWDAAVAGKSLDSDALTHPALARALSHFGRM